MFNRKNLKKGLQGFTLIELLVVIFTITFLLSIAMPSLAKTEGVAKNAVCASNLKNLGLATSLWSEDNDGWALPALWDRGYNNGSGPVLETYLSGTERGNRVMICPIVQQYAGKTFDELGLTQDVQGLAQGSNYFNSYGYNLKLCSPTSRCPGFFDEANNDGSMWGKDNVWYKTHGNCKLATVRKPSKTIMFAESIVYISYPEYYTKAMLNPAFKDPSQRGRRHNVKPRPFGSSGTEKCGQMNISWIDGSVTIEPDDMDSLSGDGRRWIINGSYWYGNSMSK